MLLILVILARNLVFYLEQPAQSLLPRHKRVEWLMNRVSYASKPQSIYPGCTLLSTRTAIPSSLGSLRDVLDDAL